MIMRNFFVAMVLVLISMRVLAAKPDQTPPTTAFTIQSVYIGVDTCSLSAKSVDGVIYHADGQFVGQCNFMRTGDTLLGYIKKYYLTPAWERALSYEPQHTDLCFDDGISKKGKKKWSCFSVSSQSQ